jgi:hypothetical protein
MPADALLYLLLWPRKNTELVATSGHLTYSIKYELYESLKINKETLQVQHMTKSAATLQVQNMTETTIMFCG